MECRNIGIRFLEEHEENIVNFEFKIEEKRDFSLR